MLFSPLHENNGFISRSALTILDRDQEQSCLLGGAFCWQLPSTKRITLNRRITAHSFIDEDQGRLPDLKYLAMVQAEAGFKLPREVHCMRTSAASLTFGAIVAPG
jgi:hypothetical protein